MTIFSQNLGGQKAPSWLRLCAMVIIILRSVEAGKTFNVS